jgi:hypothetical protein
MAQKATVKRGEQVVEGIVLPGSALEHRAALHIFRTMYTVNIQPEPLPDQGGWFIPLARLEQVGIDADDIIRAIASHVGFAQAAFDLAQELLQNPQLHQGG